MIAIRVENGLMHIEGSQNDIMVLRQLCNTALEYPNLQARASILTVTATKKETNSGG